MKKIIYRIFVLLLYTNVAIGQTTLMSDEDHRIMINNFSENLNTILLTECPQDMTIKQFKKKIINGEVQLSITAKSSINNYASSLIEYAQQFKTVNNLTTNNNAQLYFLSSFPPSTVIQNGKLIENSTIAGLTASEMWHCALASFNTSDCDITGLVSDKSDIMLLDKAATIFSTQFTGDTGVWILICGFGDCLDIASKALRMEDLQLIMENIQTFQLNGGYQKIEDIPMENIQVLINPLVENGRFLQTLIINSPESVNLINNLTLEERNEFLNLDDTQVAQLSFYIAIQQSIINNNFDWSFVESFPITDIESINVSSNNVFGKIFRRRSGGITRGYFFDNSSGCYYYGSLWVDSVNKTTYFVIASKETQYLFPKICPPEGSAWARKKI